MKRNSSLTLQIKNSTIFQSKVNDEAFDTDLTRELKVEFVFLDVIFCRAENE